MPAGKRMQAVDGKQEINLEWPYFGTCWTGLFVLPISIRLKGLTHDLMTCE